MDGNQITNEVSCREYNSTKCKSDLQTYKHDVLENLGLQISGISRQQASSILVSIGVHLDVFISNSFTSN